MEINAERCSKWYFEDDGYEEEILEHDKAEKARYLVMRSLWNKKVSPWNEAEKAMLHRVANTLQGGGHTEGEILDIALTCVYDMHVLGW